MFSGDGKYCRELGGYYVGDVRCYGERGEVVCKGFYGLLCEGLSRRVS